MHEAGVDACSSLERAIASRGTLRQGGAPCPACGGRDVALISETIKGRDGIGVVACGGCGLGRLDPLPAVEDYYRRAYQDEKNPGQDIQAVRSQAIKREDTERRWADVGRLAGPGARLLDIGCGAGGLLHAARQRSQAALCGVEPHEAFRARLRQDGFQVWPSLAECAEERFDVILLFHVLEHVEDPAGLLRAIRPVLKPGGTLVVEVPSMTDALLWRYRVPGFWKVYWQFPHVWYFSPGPLRRLLELAGFAPRRVELVQRYGLMNHLQWLNEGTPGPGEQFADLISPAMDREYRAAVVGRGLGDTVWAEASCAA